MLFAAVTITYRILQPYWAAAQQFQVNQTMDDSSRSKTCPENLKQLHKAVLLYADEWDGNLPPADHWMDLIKKNVPDDKQLHCPSIDGQANFGYAMNAALGGKRWQEVKDAARTPLFYDSSDMQPNAHDAVTSLPSPGRHEGRNNVVYVDGRVSTK
jgi:prepilin-type processing-associated H-X9-DG protein